MTINPADIQIDITFGPPGGYGFRKGNWNAKYQGRSFNFYGCVSHYAELDAQRAHLQKTAARFLENELNRQGA